MRGRTGRGRGFICDFKVIEGGLVWGVMEYPRIRVNGHGIGGKGGQRWEWEWGQSIPPSNHKNSTSAFMNVDISSISICLCRASPQEPPHLPPSPTQHTSSNLRPKHPRHTHPCISATSPRIEYIQKQPLEKHMRHGQMQSKLPIPKRRPLRARIFPNQKKKRQEKQKARKPAHPLFVCPQPAEKKPAEKECKI